MILVYILLFLILIVVIGIFTGSYLKSRKYHGVLYIQESENGLVYNLEIAGDPELLIFEDSVTFKIVPPDYQKLMSQDKLGV